MEDRGGAFLLDRDEAADSDRARDHRRPGPRPPRRQAPRRTGPRMTTEAGQRLADVAAVARVFLAATAETKPDTPRAELWHLLVAQRAHLPCVVGDWRALDRTGGG